MTGMRGGRARDSGSRARPRARPSGYRGAVGRPPLLRGARRRADDGPAAAALVDRPLADLEAAGALSRPARPGRRVRRARQRPLGPAGRPRGVRRRRAGRRRGCRPGRGRGAGSGRGRALAGRAGRCWGWPPTTRTGCAARCSSAPHVELARPAGPDRGSVRGASARATTGWWRWNAHHWRAGPGRVRGVLLRRGVPGGALDPSGRGRGGVGARDRRGDARRHPVARPPGPRRRRGAGRDREGALSVRWWCTATTTGSPRSPTGVALASALGSPLDVVVGGGHCVNARHPVWFNLRLRRFVEEVSGDARP